MRSLVLLLPLLPLGLLAQCFGTEQFPLTTVVPDVNGLPTTISTQSWAGDYALLSLTAGHSYRFSSSVPTDHITISTAVASGVLFFGVQPVVFTAAATQVFYVHFHTNSSCGVQQLARTTQVQRIYCTASTSSCGGGDESIVRVTAGGIDNLTNGCGTNGYSDFTSQSAAITVGQPLPITVLNSAPYSGDQVHVFVDWDRNFSFADAGETFILATTDNISFTGTITAPPGTPVGPVRMRVRLTYTGAVPACGNTQYGEVEDYTLEVAAAINIMFAGGDGRGDTQLAFTNGTSLAQFLGGDGRGDTHLAFSNGMALAQFQGGDGRGDMAMAFTNPIGITPFLGGDGRGDVLLAFAGTGLGQFAGGVGRGDVQLAINGFQQSQFAGGDGRGDVQLAFLNTIALAQFLGGEGRGDVMLAFAVTLPSQVLLAMRAMLDGPYNSSSGLMNDALRNLPAFPLTEPYTALGYAHTGGGGGETVAPAVLSTTGNNAIVDWVVVELRSTANQATVLASRSALLQRDGDVVATDGVSPVGFTLAAGNYHVSLRHRNHLGVMTNAPSAFGAGSAPVDLTLPTTPTYGTNARRNNNGVMTLWAGNANGNILVNYSGSNNDRTSILTLLGAATYLTPQAGYHRQDVNMNGSVNYSGSANDRTAVLNSLGAATYLTPLVEQLP
jgi:hypothetical protein